MGRQKKYITTQGDMWDSIALRLLGSETLMWMLIDANPELRGVAIFPANIELIIPDVPRKTEVLFPAWWAN